MGKHGDEDMIISYVKKQGQPENSYKKLHHQTQEASASQLDVGDPPDTPQLAAG